MIDVRKIKIWLIRNKNLINFLKIVIIVLLSIFNNTNEKFIIYIFYLLIFDPLVLIKREQKKCKYIANKFILFSISIERLIYIYKSFNIVNLILAILYIGIIYIAIKVDLIANKVKYNFEDLKNIIKKYKILNFVKILIITSMLLLVKVNILLVITIGFFNLLQLFIGNSEVDRIKIKIMDLLIFYISALAIIFKADANIIVENADMAAILGILATISFYWILNKKEWFELKYGMY